MKRATIITLALLLLTIAPGATAAPALQAPLSAGAATPAGWEEILHEGFEGAWPGVWRLTDMPVAGDTNARFWGPDDFKPYSGARSAWPASWGANAVDPQFNEYPPNLGSRMTYGPFSLEDAAEAKLAFALWAETENLILDEYFAVYASTDNVFYDEKGMWQGDLQEWTTWEADLVDYLGDPTVWLRFDFFSDEELGRQGAFVDEVVLSKLPLTAPVVSISRTGDNNGNVRLDWSADPNATGYEVWWGIDAPYYPPGASCAGAPGNCTLVTTGTSFEQAGATTNADDNYSYVVRSAKGAARSDGSNRVGEFDFQLTPGS